MSERVLEAALWPPYLTMRVLTKPIEWYTERVPKRQPERTSR